MIFSKKYKIVHAVAEVSPYSKVGGLGDVGYALPKAIHRLGHEVVIVTPYYGCVRTLNVPREKIEGNFKVDCAGAVYPVSFYKHISPDGIPIYFVVNEEFFGGHQGVYRVIEDEALRWIFFARAVLELLRIINFRPDILHCHEWHAGLIPNYLGTLYKQDPFFEPTATVFTIHNLMHQGTFFWQIVTPERLDKGIGEPPEQRNFRRWINFTKRGILFAHAITTVSERYAEEILTPKFGCGLDPFLKRRADRVFGVINGIDYEVVNPAFDPNVMVKYDVNSLPKKLKNKIELQKELGLKVDENVPLIGVVNRLTEQKGFELIMNIMPTMLKTNLQLAVVGSGQADYLKFFREVAKKNPERVSISSPFDQKTASHIYAGSDIYLMPSRYEPCGLSQLVSLRYGSIPVVHGVGGLHDTIEDFDPATDTGNGFVFQNYEEGELLMAISRACESYKYKQSWNRLVYRAMKQSFSWELPAKKYLELYHIALNLKRK
ncbi:MAG: glycogen synthase [Patescibacteria group bacterium]|nr:glycogen synthase [Patescibacteria group bacterium]